MRAALISEREYRALVGKVLPIVVSSETEYRRLLDAAEELVAIEESKMTPEEGRLLELLAMLIQEYEERTYPLEKNDPAKMLRYLMEERGVKAGDLVDILPRSRVSEILSGKRSISKTQARQLADFFHADVDLFL